MRGLLIHEGPIKQILSGRKTWEIRGSSTKIRGTIALIQSGSGQIVGRCKLVDVVGPLTLKEMRSTKKHGIAKAELTGLYYKKTFAWVLKDARRLRRPIPYRHHLGAVIWVKLPDDVFEQRSC